MPTRPSPRSERLGTPKIPAIRFTRGSSFEASLVRVCYGLSGCSPPWTDRTKFPWPTGDFYIQASGGSVALPAAGYDYNSNWTPLLAGLLPAGKAASLAAQDLDSPHIRARPIEAQSREVVKEALRCRLRLRLFTAPTKLIGQDCSLIAQSTHFFFGVVDFRQSVSPTTPRKSAAVIGGL